MILQTLLRLSSLVVLLAAAGCADSAAARPAPTTTETPPTPTTTARTRPLTRLLYEDHADQRLKSVDVLIDDTRALSLTPAAVVEGFPTLDPSRQKLVQMRESQGYVMVGVRDDSEGKFESGWIVVDSGVRQHDHGDHVHWSFRTSPTVKARRLDASQGNPAHLYEYDGRFYLANDRLNGYTRIDPAELRQASDPAAASRFIPGGGNHITLAVVDDQVGYSCWIDGGGPNCGRVDVTPLGEVRTEPAYSLKLPSGGIHGAIAHSGRVFFAPSDGVCWVDVDLDAACPADEVTVQHLSLGTRDDKPRRTGAFVNAGRYVVCVAGKEADAGLALIDAAADSPQVLRLPLEARSGEHVTTPTVITRRDGSWLALVCHDHEADAQAQDRLTIVELDPNGDGAFDDARILKQLDIGPSAVEGHYGHHALACDADRRYAFITNPGDGTLSVLSLATLELVQTFPLGGKPTAVVAIGGREIRD